MLTQKLTYKILPVGSQHWFVDLHGVRWVEVDHISIYIDKTKNEGPKYTVQPLDGDGNIIWNHTGIENFFPTKEEAESYFKRQINNNMLGIPDDAELPFGKMKE